MADNLSTFDIIEESFLTLKIKKLQFNRDHVEKPERLSKITTKIEEWKLKERMLFVEGASALSSDILTTHSKKLFDMIKATDKSAPRDLIQKQQKYDSLYLHPDTFKSATMAVGSVLKVCFYC